MSKNQANTAAIDKLLEQDTLGLYMHTPEEITEETDLYLLMITSSELFGSMGGDERQDIIYNLLSIRDACIALKKYHTLNTKGVDNE